MNAAVGNKEVSKFDNNNLGKKNSVTTSGKQDNLSNRVVRFNVPLSIFQYKGYDSDFVTSWYNVSSEIFKEINKACPEKKVLNLALSVLMLPYIAFTALGLVIYNRFKANGKTQACPEGSKTKKSEVSESVPKRLAYGVLAAIAILVNIAVLVALIMPATLALATFYLLNSKVSHSLIDALKISNGLYHNKHQNTEVSSREMDAGESEIRWDMEIKFPSQFEQLLRDLCEDENDKLFITRDAENNTILKLSANIHLKNVLMQLRNEIRSVVAASVQGLAKTMEELLKLEKKDITYNKLKELLNKSRLGVVDSVGPKLTSYLIQDAYRVTFIQAIKFAQREGKRSGDFSLEERLKEVLVEQELKNQGKGLLVKDAKMAERGIIDNYRSIYPKETAEALRKAEEMIKKLKEMGEKRYNEVCEKLKEIYKKGRISNSTDGALKRKLEDLFKFEYDDDQEVEKRLIKSRIRKAEVMLDQSGVLDKGIIEQLTQSIWNRLSSYKDKNLKEQLKDLEKEVEVLSSGKALGKVNDFIKEMYLEITKCRMQSLFKGQAKGMETLCKPSEKDAPAPDLVEKINLHRMRIEKYLKRPEQPILLKRIIEGNKDLNKYLKEERNSKGKEHPNTELIEKHLENNKNLLEVLEQLNLKKEGLLINKEAKNHYREELESREKIKFVIIEDGLLEEFKKKTFNEKEIKKLLEEAELEYCLAEKRIKYPIIKIRDNTSHFCRDLLSPLISNLAKKIINHVPQNIPKDTESNGIGWNWIHRNVIKPMQIALNYNRVGWSAINKGSTEGKALEVVHDTYTQAGMFLEHFGSSFEEVGGLIGNVFSDDGETFKKDIWPHIRDHLCETWDRFFKDIEFTLISKDKKISQETGEAVGYKLDKTITQQHVDNPRAAGA